MTVDGGARNAVTDAFLGQLPLHDATTRLPAPVLAEREHSPVQDEALGWLTELYDLHGSRVYGIAVAMLGAGPETEPVVTAAVEDAFRALARGGAQTCDARGAGIWLVEAVRRRAISLGASPHGNATPLLAGLTRDERDCLEYARSEGLHVAAIAERMSRPVSEVSALLGSALRELARNAARTPVA